MTVTPAAACPAHDHVTCRYGMGTMVRKGTVMVLFNSAPVVGSRDWYENETVTAVRLASKPTVLMKLMVVIAEAACALITAVSGPAQHNTAM